MLKYFVASTCVAGGFAENKNPGAPSHVGNICFWNTLEGAEAQAAACLKTSGVHVYVGEIKQLNKLTLAPPPVVRERLV